MSTIAARPAHRSLRTRLGTIAAVGAVAAALVAAGPAAAQPKSGTGSAKGCPVEHEDGSITYVPVGSQIGLFHCGSDGEWHFGWLTTDLVKPPTVGTGPVIAGTTATTTTMAVAR
jgi:hypothetical protein